MKSAVNNSMTGSSQSVTAENDGWDIAARSFEIEDSEVALLTLAIKFPKGTSADDVSERAAAAVVAAIQGEVAAD